MPVALAPRTWPTTGCPGARTGACVGSCSDPGRAAGGAERRLIPIPAHSYRMALLLGVQPRRAGALLDDADGGTPQRFLWLPTTDPLAPDVRLLPSHNPCRCRRRPGGLPLAARHTIEEARRARLRGQESGLDGHARECTRTGEAHPSTLLNRDRAHDAGVLRASRTATAAAAYA